MANSKSNQNRNHDNVLLSSLPSAERKRLEPYLENVRLEADQELVEFDKPIEYLWFPRNAVTSTLVSTDEGSFLEVGLMGAEGVVGLSLLFGERLSNSTVIVQLAGDGIRMRAEDFESQVLSNGGPLYQMMQRYCNAFMSMLAQSAVCNSTHPIDERMCRWVLMTHDRVKHDHMRLRQKFLAMMLGVRRPAVILTASVLKQAGIIDFTRDTVTVLDRKKLEQGCCECYGIINHQLNRVFNHEWRPNAERL